MKLDNKEMTDAEFDVHSEAITQCLNVLIKCADQLNCDRDSYIQAATTQLAGMAEICTFRNFKA